jgi:hypothetical protein
MVMSLTYDSEQREYVGERCRIPADMFDAAVAGLATKGLDAAEAHGLLLDEAMWAAPGTEGASAPALPPIPGSVARIFTAPRLASTPATQAHAFGVVGGLFGVGTSLLMTFLGLFCLTLDENSDFGGGPSLPGSTQLRMVPYDTTVIWLGISLLIAAIGAFICANCSLSGRRPTFVRLGLLSISIWYVFCVIFLRVLLLHADVQGVGGFRSFFPICALVSAVPLCLATLFAFSGNIRTAPREHGA